MFTSLDLLKSAFYFLALRFNRIPASVILFLFDIILFFVATFFWLAFFSQFVLPLKTLNERYRALDRLLLYMMGEHGPAIYIENGKVRERRLEMRRKGPGLMILDTASGAVLRNDFSFTRPVGPGVVFTQRNEYLAKAVDLHGQVARLGPEGDEDPFAPRNPQIDAIETEDSYERRQERRLETRGLTRDGVEVVPNVQVVYRLKRRPGDNSYSFGFNAVAVLQWARADGTLSITPATPEQDHISLHKLPAHLAVEVWRESLQKFTLSQLFTTPILELERGETAYATILRMLRERLTRPRVTEYNSAGQPTGQMKPSREFRMLRDRGIQVLGVSVTNLRFDPSVERRLIQQWVATWLQREQAQRSLVERQRSFAALQGRREAVERFAHAAIREFDQEVLSLPRPRDEREELAQMRIALERLAEGIRSEYLSDPQLLQLFQVEETGLRELLAWIGEQSP